MITPTQFIYLAAKRTPEVTTPMGKKVTYSFPDVPNCKDERCWLCGGKTDGKGALKKDTIKPTFTDHDVARAPGKIATEKNIRLLNAECTLADADNELFELIILGDCVIEDALSGAKTDHWKFIKVNPKNPKCV